MKAKTGAAIATNPKSSGASKRESMITDTNCRPSLTACALPVAIMPRPTDALMVPATGSNRLDGVVRVCPRIAKYRLASTTQDSRKGLLRYVAYVSTKTATSTCPSSADRFKVLHAQKSQPCRKNRIYTSPLPCLASFVLALTSLKLKTFNVVALCADAGGSRHGKPQLDL